MTAPFRMHLADEQLMPPVPVPPVAVPLVVVPVAVPPVAVPTGPPLVAVPPVAVPDPVLLPGGQQTPAGSEFGTQQRSSPGPAGHPGTEQVIDVVTTWLPAAILQLMPTDAHEGGEPQLGVEG